MNIPKYQKRRNVNRIGGGGGGGGGGGSKGVSNINSAYFIPRLGGGAKAPFPPPVLTPMNIIGERIIKIVYMDWNPQKFEFVSLSSFSMMGCFRAR